MLEAAKARIKRHRKGWRIVLGIVLCGLVALIAVALIPPGRHYEPAPYFKAVKQSATLPVSRGDTPQTGTLIIRHARIVDVKGRRGPTSIRIDAGRIAAISDDVPAAGMELDINGATVMPGLIDAHVHLSLTPGGLTRSDDAETTRSLRLHHMRAYLASGITTIFDPAVENVVMEDIQRSLEAGNAGPRYLGVGTPMSTPGGYMESLWPPGIRTVDEVGPQLDGNIRAGAVGVKMSFETGFVSPAWRLHPPGIDRAIVQEAAKRHLPLYVHAERADMVRRALAVHPYALTHAPLDGTRQLSTEIAAARIPVITTLALFDAGSVMLHPDPLEAANIRRVVPAIELDTLHDRRQNRDYLFGLITEGMSFVPGRYRDLLAWVLTTKAGLRATENENRKAGRSAMQTVRYLKEAGVTLVVGSDSGNWPLFPYYFHGPTTVRELRLLASRGRTVALRDPEGRHCQSRTQAWYSGPSRHSRRREGRGSHRR